MPSPAAKADRSPLALLTVVLVALEALACAGKQTGDEGDASEYEPTTVVENTSPQPSTAPSEEPEMLPEPSLPGGPLDACGATTWANPDEPRTEAGCRQHWDSTGDEPVLRYICSCDTSECPIYDFDNWVDDDDPSTPPEHPPPNDCVIDGVPSGCQDSLVAACGLTVGNHGFCEREYYGLAPTRPEQDPPESATVVCFEAADGTHACACPDEAALVPTPEADCNRALVTACQTSCESTAGRCDPTDNGYECTCAAGFERTVETGLCDYALFFACEPACSNDNGACYWDPSGSSEITCLCDEPSAAQGMTPDPSFADDECRAPLVETCGGSGDGPGTWP